MGMGMGKAQNAALMKRLLFRHAGAGSLAVTPEGYRPRIERFYIRILLLILTPVKPRLRFYKHDTILLIHRIRTAYRVCTPPTR